MKRTIRIKHYARKGHMVKGHKKHVHIKKRDISMEQFEKYLNTVPADEREYTKKVFNRKRYPTPISVPGLVDHDISMFGSNIRQKPTQEMTRIFVPRPVVAKPKFIESKSDEAERMHNKRLLQQEAMKRLGINSLREEVRSEPIGSIPVLKRSVTIIEDPKRRTWALPTKDHIGRNYSKEGRYLFNREFEKED